MLRGGSWNNKPRNTRAANRNNNTPDNRNNNSGFRVASASVGRVRPGRAGIRAFTEARSAASEAQVRSRPDLFIGFRPNIKPARRRPVGLARKLPPGLAIKKMLSSLPRPAKVFVGAHSMRPRPGRPWVCRGA
ncbi:MAG: SUMF1/EgtB/PvdO family nonheme iron enzyme [Thermodesulfobacteriota bacterium]